MHYIYKGQKDTTLGIEVSLSVYNCTVVIIHLLMPRFFVHAARI